MTASDLSALRSRFLDELAREELQVVGTRHRTWTRRFRRAVAIDREAGVAIVRRDGEEDDRQHKRLEIGLDALTGAWPGLVAAGTEGFGLDSAEQNGLAWLHLMVEEAVDSEALGQATDLVLTWRGTFEPRGSFRAAPPPSTGSASTSAG